MSLLDVVLVISNRREETVLSRLHIGHLYVTHSFLLKGEEPPVCIRCDELLTIENMVLFCSDLIDIRELHFTARTLRLLKCYSKTYPWIASLAI